VGADDCHVVQARYCRAKHKQKGQCGNWCIGDQQREVSLGSSLLSFAKPVLQWVSSVIDLAISFHSAEPPLSDQHVALKISLILSNAKTEELAYVARSILHPLSSVIEGIVAHAETQEQMLWKQHVSLRSWHASTIASKPWLSWGSSAKWLGMYVLFFYGPPFVMRASRK